MNNPHPLIPQGSILEQKNQGRARFRVGVFFVLAAHVVVIGAMLMQGCKREEPAPKPPETLDAYLPPIDTNALAPLDDVAPVVDDPALTTPALPPAYIETVVPPAVPPAPVDTAMTEYTVAAGDSFYTIGKKFGVSMNAIASANPSVEPTRLKIGQKLQIPAASAVSAPTVSNGSAAIQSGGAKIHVVKSGETLTKIASQHGTTIKAIRSANNLRTDMITVGQKLKIPASGSTP